MCDRKQDGSGEGTTEDEQRDANGWGRERGQRLRGSTDDRSRSMRGKGWEEILSELRKGDRLKTGQGRERERKQELFLSAQKEAGKVS
jgi:hypothetical protein